MNPLRKAYCRIFQTCFRIALPVLPYREPRILTSTDDVPGLLRERSVQSVLLVTDPGLKSLGLIDSLLAALREADIACPVYADVVPNPTVANVESALSLYKRHNCQAVIGFGGGSPMDCAKGVAARVAQPNKTLSRMRGLLKVHARTPLLIAVPTTAGTGSEVTLAAVITDGESHYKYVINDFSLIPDVAVHDPRLTLGLPPHVTSTTGMDALTHAVEAYIGRSTNAFTRDCAERAVVLIHDNLQAAYRDGADMQARANMLTASYLAGNAFTRSYVGYVHGIAHSLGGQYGVPHGLANAIILPHMLRAYRPVCDEKLAKLARIANIAPADADDATAAGAFIEWVDEMNASMGIPRYVEGIVHDDIPLMAAHADAESNPLYPVPVLMDAGELAGMYKVVAGWEDPAAPAAPAADAENPAADAEGPAAGSDAPTAAAPAPAPNHTEA